MSIEAHVIDALSATLGVPVRADVPKDRPAVLVTVERTAGGRDHYGMLDRPQLAVQSWAPTRHEAAQLADRVDGAMHALVGWPVTRVTTDRIYNFPAEGSPRYQGVYDLVCHVTEQEG